MANDKSIGVMHPEVLQSTIFWLEDEFLCNMPCFEILYAISNFWRLFIGIWIWLFGCGDGFVIGKDDLGIFLYVLKNTTSMRSSVVPFMLIQKTVIEPMDPIRIGLFQTSRVKSCSQIINFITTPACLVAFSYGSGLVSLNLGLFHVQPYIQPSNT